MAKRKFGEETDVWDALSYMLILDNGYEIYPSLSSGDTFVICQVDDDGTAVVLKTDKTGKAAGVPMRAELEWLYGCHFTRMPAAVMP